MINDQSLVIFSLVTFVPIHHPMNTYVITIPSEKMMEYVSWDDYAIYEMEH